MYNKIATSFKDLITREDELIDRKEKIDNRIVSVLYILEDETDDTRRRIAQEELDGLNNDLETVKEDLKTIRASLRRYMLRMFGEIDN